MMELRKNKGGRPRKDPAERASVNFTMRVRPDRYEELRRAAELNGRSISAEGEWRLSLDPVHEIARMISIVLKQVEKSEGKYYNQDTGMKTQCRAAADQALDLMLGQYIDPITQKEIIELQVKKLRSGNASVLDRIVDMNTTLTDQEIVEHCDKLADTLKGLRAARAALGKPEANS